VNLIRPRLLIVRESGPTKEDKKRSSWIVPLLLGFLTLGVLIGIWRTPPKTTPTLEASGIENAVFVLQRDLAQRDARPTEVSRGTTAAQSNMNGEENASSSPSQEKEVKLLSYTVKEGDTLSALAQRFGTSVESIVSINGLLSPDRLSVGDELTIIQNAKGTICRVEKGDTLWDISRAYGVPIEEIVKVNSLKSADDITPGQLLLLPGAKLPGALAQVASSSRSSGLSWPLSGSVTDGFGWRTHPITGQRQFHEGLDIAASEGTPVRAAAGGTVSYADWMAGYGRLVVIQHGNGVETRYGHLRGLAVSTGQRVVAGKVIGYVGQTGDATGPHLHFEVRVGGQPKNPRNYLP